ncbi:MAG: hypothetical protein ACC628_08075 [Pirellulaceae bacterium]
MMKWHHSDRRAWLSRVVWMLAVTAFASSVHGHGSGDSAPKSKPTSGTRKIAVTSSDDLHLDRNAMVAPHGGQVTASKWHYFEVVYGPKETRIYVFSPSQRYLFPQRAHGDVIMQINGNPEQYRYPVKYATDEEGMGYLFVTVDIRLVRDGDMQVEFELTDLPFKEERRAAFSQTFALLRRPSVVREVPLMESDRAWVTQQRTCPVMGAPLGQQGTPVKVSISGQSLFVCCQGCVDRVVQTPEVYLQKAIALSAPPSPVVRLPAVVDAGPPAARPAAPHVTVATATAADEAAIRDQGVFLLGPSQFSKAVIRPLLRKASSLFK